MAVPSIVWDETNPADNQAFNLGDDRIRELKKQVEEVFAIDHYMLSSGQSVDWGTHNYLTLIEQASHPATYSTGYILYTKEVSSKAELHCKTPAGTAIQLTSKGNWIGGMSGEIRMWSGTIANIPAGWHLCSGGSYPNLLHKFLKTIPTAITAPGSGGGADTITLSAAHLISHNHTISGDGAHTHDVYAAPSGSGYGEFKSSANVSTNLETTTVIGDHYHTLANVGSGSPTPIDNMPAYYELAFICR